MRVLQRPLRIFFPFRKFDLTLTYVLSTFFTTLFQNETTALHVACMDNLQAQDSATLCDLLTKAGAKVDAIDVDGHTPLHFCCLYGLSDSAKILVRPSVILSFSPIRFDTSSVFQYKHVFFPVDG